MGQVEDILFAAGEALSFLWGGVPITIDVILKTNYSSLSMSSNFLMGDVSSSFPRASLMKFQDDGSYHVTVRNTITRKLFDVLLYSNRKEERCAGAVWLLSLTIYCGHHETIQQLLPDIQVNSQNIGCQHCMIPFVGVNNLVLQMNVSKYQTRNCFFDENSVSSWICSTQFSRLFY